MGFLDRFYRKSMETDENREERNPEKMPTEWTISRFEHDKGIGGITRDDENEVTFDVTAWNVDTETMSRADQREAMENPKNSPEWPKVGEPVRVKWKRSVTGRVVPSVVEPIGRAPARVRYTIRQWLKAFSDVTGYLQEYTYRKLMDLLSKLDEEIPDEWSCDEKYEAEGFAELLAQIAMLKEVQPALHKKHAWWVYHDDHRWDREAASDAFPVMLDIEPGLVSPEGPEESLSIYAERWNAKAEELGKALRLFDLSHGSDFNVIIAIKPEAFQKLKEKEYLL